MSPRRLSAAILTLAFAACEGRADSDAPHASEAPAPAPARTTVAQRSGASTAVAYESRSFVHTRGWESITERSDGRYHGTSLRTFRYGARAAFDFTGTKIRIFGVLGRRGGVGLVSLDGEATDVMNFYAPHKMTHRIVYTSPTLRRGKHHLAVENVSMRDRSTVLGYVNLDGVEIVR